MPIPETPAQQPIALAGIPLLIREPMEYIRELARSFAIDYPDLQHVLGDLRVDTSVQIGDGWDKSSTAILAYSQPKQIYEVVVKDWGAGEENECDPLTNYMAEQDLLRGVGSAAVCGAGVGRLSDFLIGELGLKNVINIDMSWLVLYIGRMILQGQEDQIPALLRQARLVYEADAQHRDICLREVPLVLHTPRAPKDADIRFEVRDCFDFQPVEADALLICNFVETHRHRLAATLTLQMFRQLGQGQKLLHVTWVSSEEDTGRSPELVLEMARICGCDVDWVDFLQLPYSRHTRFIGAARSQWKNLVIRGVKRREPDLDRIYLDLNRHDKALCTTISEIVKDRRLFWRRRRWVNFTEAELAVLRSLVAGPATIATVQKISDQQGRAFGDGVGHLASLGMLTLQIDPPAADRSPAACSLEADGRAVR